MLNLLTLVFHLGPLDLQRLDALHALRSNLFVEGLGSIWINLGKALRILRHEIENVELMTIDVQDAVFSVGNLTKEDCILVIQRLLRLNHD